MKLQNFLYLLIKTKTKNTRLAWNKYNRNNIVILNNAFMDINIHKTKYGSEINCIFLC